MTASAPRKKVGDADLDFGRYAGLGLQFALTLGLTGGLGWWLDSWLGSSPWLLVVGVFAGGGLAFYTLVHSVPPTHDVAAQTDRDASASDPDDPRS